MKSFKLLTKAEVFKKLAEGQTDIYVGDMNREIDEKRSIAFTPILKSSVIDIVGLPGTEIAYLEVTSTN